jgi:hypothetical protein
MSADLPNLQNYGGHTGLFTIGLAEERTEQTATTDLYVEHDYGK